MSISAFWTGLSVPRSSDGDALDLDLPSGLGEAADDQSARGLAVAKHLAARLAGNSDIAGGSAE
jgi:hypothetical protein